MKKWSITRPDEAAAGALTKGSDLEPLCAVVLAARGIRTVQAAADFLGSDELSDPFLIRDMQEAAEVINEAVESGKPICVYGDYDCESPPRGCCTLIWNVWGRMCGFTYPSAARATA